MKPRLLTIKGITRSIFAWSLQPGAANHTTISWWLRNFGWDAEKAVFTPSLRPLKASTIRVRIVGINRPSRSNGARLKRPPVRRAPAPHLPNPHPPTWGGFASYPIEALPLLRRVA